MTAPERVPAGKVTDPDDISVAAIATNDSGATSLIGKSTCPDGPCIVMGSPTDARDYRVAPTKDRLHSMKFTATETARDEPGIQVGSDPSNSWAWTDALYSTHDSGKTWQPAELPTSLDVEDVEANNGRVWAFGHRPDGRPVVATSAEDTDNWSTEQVPVQPDESIDTPMVVEENVAFVATDKDSHRSELVRRDNGGWERRTVQCPDPVKSGGSDNTYWLGCRTPRGSDYVTWSHDGGSSWNVEMVDRTGLSAVDGVDSDTAVAATGDDLIVVNSDGTTRKAATPYDASDDVWKGQAGYDSVRVRDDGTGFATTNGGALARTKDGGHTWKPANLP